MLQSGDGAPVAITTGHPLHTFSGDVPTTCDLIDGPVRDVNLMIRRARATAVMRDVARSPTLSGSGWWAGMFATAACTIALDDGPPIELPELALAWIDNPDRALYTLRVVNGPSTGWWIDVTPRERPFLTPRGVAG